MVKRKREKIETGRSKEGEDFGGNTISIVESARETFPGKIYSILFRIALDGMRIPSEF